MNIQRIIKALTKPKIMIIWGIFICLILGYNLGLFNFFSLQSLKQNATQLQIWKKDHFTLTSFAFIGLYISSVALSVPISTLLSIVAGFLFGRLIGTFYVVMAGSLGAILLYITVRWIMTDFARSKIDEFMAKIEKGLKKDGFWYILSLRLMPAFPFWILNLTCAMFKAPIRQYTMATFLGIICNVTERMSHHLKSLSELHVIFNEITENKQEMVRPRRLELPRDCSHNDLNVARLPIPPRPQKLDECCYNFSFLKNQGVFLFFDFSLY